MQAVLFDADGVIYFRKQKQQHLRSFLQRHLLPIPDQETIRRANRTVHAQASCGLIEPQAWYEAVLDAHHVTDPAWRSEGCQALAADNAAITLFAGVAETLPALKARGLRLGIVTNTTSPTTEKLRWLHDQGLIIAWDAFASSRDVGVRKPDPRIYEAALKQCGVTANQAIFVGHSATELTGAKVVGLATAAINADPGAEADYMLIHFADLLDLPSCKRRHNVPGVTL